MGQRRHGANQCRAGRRLTSIVMTAGLLGPALCVGASWRFDGSPSAGLDYGPAPVVTTGPSGAFSCFATFRLDNPPDADRFIVGRVDDGLAGWRILVDRTVGDTGDENRIAFWVSGGDGLETERYAADEVAPGSWVTVGGSYSWNPAIAGPGADMHLYVDGAENAALPRFDTGHGPADVADALMIGRSAEGTDAMVGKLGYIAIWDGVGLDAATHALLAAGADPRTIHPDQLAFFARLEEPDAADLITELIPSAGAGANFDTDRWPAARPLITGLGDVTPTSIKVLSSVGRTAVHRIVYGTGGAIDMESKPIASEESLDHVVVHGLDGLEPATTYQYRVLIDDEIAVGGAGSFTTMPTGDANAFRFVVSTCTEFDAHEPKQGFPRYPHLTFRGIADRNPAFAVHTGDVWYSDSGGADADTPFNAWSMNTVDAFNRKVRQMLGEREFASFRRNFTFYTMPDDHEFRNNVAAGQRSDDPNSKWQRALGRVMNWQFQTNPARTELAIADDGLWYTFSHGDVDFFFLDMRTQRGINGNPGVGTMLGNTEGVADGQLGELLAWLDGSTAAFKVILAPSMLSDFGTTGNDSWQSAFPDDQQFVIDALRQRRDVVYFAGDVHWSGAIRLGADDDGNPAHDLYEFVSGTFGGHLSDPPDAHPDLLFAYDGATVSPHRFSYLVVDVDTTVIPARMVISLVSSDSESGVESVEYTHLPILSQRTCPGDLNGDGLVAFGDLLSVLANWGPCPGDCDEDLDDDGVVAFSDLLHVLSVWGPCEL